MPKACCLEVGTAITLHCGRAGTNSPNKKPVHSLLRRADLCQFGGELLLSVAGDAGASLGETIGGHVDPDLFQDLDLVRKLRASGSDHALGIRASRTGFSGG